MSVVFELGKLNTDTGAEESDDQIVRMNAIVLVTAGLSYTFTNEAEGTDVKIFWFDMEGNFISYTDGATGIAPEGVYSARVTVNTAGVTGFVWTFEPDPVYQFVPTLSFSGNPTPFVWNLGDGTTVTGFAVQHSYEDSTLKQVEVVAQTKDWQALEALSFKSCNIVGTLDLSVMDVMQQAIIDVSDNSQLTLIVFAQAVAGHILKLLANDCALGYVSLLPLAGCFDLSNVEINLADNDMPELVVDRMLYELDLITQDGYESRVIHIDGSNAAPTGGGETGYDGLAAVSSLEAKGFTVNVS
jgi:hypothetical protein